MKTRRAKLWQWDGDCRVKLPVKAAEFAGDFDESKIVRADGGRFGDKADTEKAGDEDKQALELAAKEYQEKGVRAEAFKNWFGDWENDPAKASKVVDKATGEPKETQNIPGVPVKIYHGSPEKFDAFSKDKFGTTDSGWYGTGVYFTTDKDVASSYTRGSGNIVEAYLNIRNPLQIDSSYGLQDGELAEMLREVLPKGHVDYFIKEKTSIPEIITKHVGPLKFTELVKSKGYDGILKSHTKETVGHDSQEWIAFEPHQIKAVENRGTFDPKSKDIRFSLADQIEAEINFAFDESAIVRAEGGRFGEKPDEAKEKEKTADRPLKTAPAPKGVRAFEGQPVELKTKLSKQESGKIGEAVILSYLHSKGLKDARPMNLDRNNFPVDLVQNSKVIEVKTGMVSNQRDAQKWRLTIGEPGKKEKEWLASASDEQKAAWNAKKQVMITKRKEAALKELQKRVGKPIKPATMTVLLNPDKKVADIFMFDGWHQILRWKSEEAKAAYVGSVQYS